MTREEQYKEALSIMKGDKEIHVDATERAYERVNTTKYLSHINKLSVESLRILRNEIYRELKHCEMLHELYTKNKAPRFLLSRIKTRAIILKKHRRAIQHELKERFNE